MRSTVERAFELAKSGACRSFDEIRDRLHQEKYDGVELHLAGPLVRRQLRQICASALEHEDQSLNS